jgi:dihydropteroate synthase
VSTAAADRELLFGATALALRPRVLALGDTGVPAEERTVRISVQPRGLSERARESLTGLDEVRFAPGLGTSDGESAILTCPRPLLAAAAEVSEEGRVMLEAVLSVERPAAPPRLMGVVNVTPDSFSDGGRWLEPARAVEHGLRLEAEGAALLDVGGESTRPGAQPVSERVELERVLAVVEGLAEHARIPISIDTTKASVARACLEAGATIVNDVSAGRADPQMLPLIAERGCGFIAMHMRGEPRSMQRAPRYSDPVEEVCEFLRDRLAACLQAGAELRRMTLDPGIGFGKRLRHNLELLRRLPELRSLGRPLCVGVSRKSFIAHATGELSPEDWEGNRPTGTRDRLAGGAAAICACVLGGAEILRVHDVAQMAEATAVAVGVSRGAGPTDSNED